MSQDQGGSGWGLGSGAIRIESSPFLEKDLFSSLYSWLPTPSTGQALGGRPSTGGEGPAVGKGPYSGRPGWPGTGTPASHTASLLTPDGSRASCGPRSLLTRGHSAGATASALRIGCGAGLFPPPLPLAGPQPVPTLADPWEPARKGGACQKRGRLPEKGGPGPGWRGERKRSEWTAGGEGVLSTWAPAWASPTPRSPLVEPHRVPARKLDSGVTPSQPCGSPAR